MKRLSGARDITLLLLKSSFQTPPDPKTELQIASSNQFEDLFLFCSFKCGKFGENKNKSAPYTSEARTISSFTLILGINFFHEGNTSLQITRQWLHQLQILFHIVDDHLARVAIGWVQHGGAAAPAHNHPAPLSKHGILRLLQKDTYSKSFCTQDFQNPKTTIKLKTTVQGGGGGRVSDASLGRWHAIIRPFYFKRFWRLCILQLKLR